MPSEAVRIDELTIYWDPRIPGRRKLVPVDIYLADQESAPDAYLYLGYGEGQKSLRHGVETVGRAGLRACAVDLPLRSLSPTTADYARIVSEVPVFVAETINEMHGARADTPRPAIGKSQGGGAVLMSAGRAGELFGSLALIAPVGLTSEHFGDNPAAKTRSFLARLAIHNSRAPDMAPHLPGNIAATAEIVAHALNDFMRGHFGSTISFALHARLERALIDTVGRGHPIRIFLAEDDPVFPVHEVEDALSQLGLLDLIEIVPGSHSPALNRAGEYQIQRAARWLQSTDIGTSLS